MRLKACSAWGEVSLFETLWPLLCRYRRLAASRSQRFFALIKKITASLLIIYITAAATLTQSFPVLSASVPLSIMPKSLSSERRRVANRANARRSTGPHSAAGKAKSSLNAVKTGLTGRTVLLPSDDVAAYQAHIKRCVKAFAPVGTLEEQVVQTLADLQWRLNRIPSLETGLLALARRRCAPDLFQDEPNPQMRAVLLEAHLYETAAKSLENLQRQENRLGRQYAQEIKELERLRAERQRAEEQAAQEEEEEECDCEDCQREREKQEKKEVSALVKRLNGFEFSNLKTEPQMN
jgi:hypothetical protein